MYEKNVFKVFDYCNQEKNIWNFVCRTQKQPPELFYKNSVLEKFGSFTGKHLCQILFFNKRLRVAVLFKKRPWHMCFPVNCAKFWKALLFAEHIQVAASDILVICFPNTNTFSDFHRLQFSISAMNVMII